MASDIPVYFVTGFLEGGKTSFLKFTLSQDYFNDGSKTLIILCEEGEEEFEKDFLKKYNAELEIIEGEENLNVETLKNMGRMHRPERVIIEYNGMWSPKKISELELPYTWQLYQTITVLDGGSFQLYLNNIKSLAIELLTYTDMVVFNRCKEDTPIDNFNRSIKAVNSQAEVMFEDVNGEVIQPALELPYDVNQETIELKDEDYAIWYIDVQEHPENYEGKKIIFKAMVMKNKDFPSDVFVPGRSVMTCCEADIQFLGFACIYDKADELRRRSWVTVTAVFNWEYLALYKEEGPVLHAVKVDKAEAPQNETLSF